MGLIFFGVILVVLGIPLRMFVGRRQFNPRNEAGVEEFGSYGAMVSTRFLEGAVHMLAMAGIFVGLLLAGCGALLWRLSGHDAAPTPPAHHHSGAGR